MIERSGAVAYCLITYIYIHPVFHVSLPKKAIRPNHLATDALHVITDVSRVPIEVL